MSMLSAAQVAAAQALLTSTFNTTINLIRPGVRGAAETTIATGRRCRLRRPNKTAEQSLPDGTMVTLILHDVPDAPYRPDDIVEVTQRDGHSNLGPITKYRVGSVEQSPRAVPTTLCGLVGVGGYQ